MSRHDAQQLLRHCIEEGSVIPGFHFREELRNERIQLEDAYVVLAAGNIYDEPEQDLRTGRWTYRVEGYEPGGKWMAIVFRFGEMNGAFLITIFSVESRRKKR